ncbi:MAG: endonuclease V [Chloroflexi bacterium RBG_16_57_11]|nr:MAG: endonuclease V [Chloroflexi bacterium RBG_16_57_11]
MPFRSIHSWQVTAQGAIAIQESLRDQVIREDRFGVINTVAGIDVGFEEGGGITRAAVVVLGYPGLELAETSVVRRPTSFPYVPGLLSFREAPAVLEAIERLSTPPDLLFCDGQGIAHPRRLGLASHLGLWTDLPSIGAAKSRLIGQHEPVGERRGDWQPLYDAGELIGAALRTRPTARPLYISIGHRISLETAIRMVLSCTRVYRLPEPTRQAHHLASLR